MGTTQLLILGGLALAAWYLWPTLQQSLQPASSPESSPPTADRPPPAAPPAATPVAMPAAPVVAPAPVNPRSDPSACDAVKALVIMRDRLEAIQAPRGDINRLLEFAPQLLSKDGFRGNDFNASPLASGGVRPAGGLDPAGQPQPAAPAQS